MTAGIIAVFVNLALNYILIFGNFGAPEMGVRGAAVATVVSRFSELLIVAFWTLRHREKNPFIAGAFRSLRVPLSLVRRILAKGLPLMLNETMWAGGMATVNRFYSLRGLDVVAANNINITFFNVFSVAFMSAGMSIGIILGQMLGAGETAKAKDSARKLIAFSVALSFVVAGVYAALSGVIPGFYSVPDSVRTLATGLMLVCAAAMPLDAFANASYFTLRSGGQALITFIFDSGFVWAVTVPAAFIIQRFTDIPIIPMYAIVQGLNLLKCAVGYLFFRTGRWATNIVSEEKAEV
jgi:Na+-driven multidrug efflux pump